MRPPLRYPAPLGSLCENLGLRVIPRSRKRRGISRCSEIGCHSERSEESRPGLFWAVRPTQSKIPRFARNDMTWFLGAAGGMGDCLENAQSEIPRSARNDSIGRVITQTLREGAGSFYIFQAPG